jgi:hypothetical protein
MTDTANLAMHHVINAEERIKRCEAAIERLCTVFQLNGVQKQWPDRELELIRQYVRGDLEPRYETTVEQPGPHDGPPFPYWKER